MFRKLLATLLLLTLLVTTALPAVAAAGPVTPSGLSFAEMERQIEELMQEHVGTSTPGAAIVVVHEGEIIFSRGYGWADIDNQIPVDPATTVFEYASIGKTFTWVAVMQLVEQGLLDLDADITTYLPDSFRFEMPFTMRDILNHTPGFAETLFGPSFDGQRLPTLEEALLAGQPLQIFTPGTVSAYSNWGSALAGLVVAEISGQSFADFERENILLPANMRNTLNIPDWFRNDSFLANRVQGYIAVDGAFLEQAPIYVFDYPAGALNGTAEDLAAFIKALTPPAGESGPLFADAESLRTIFSSSSLDPINRPGTNHGFLSYSGALPGFGHGGNLLGSSTDFVIVPELRFGFVLLTNVGGEMDLMPAIQTLLLGNPPAPMIGTGLPSAEAVEGQFISARRLEGNFAEFVSFSGFMMPMFEITALDDNTILASFGEFGSAIYVQTEPYVFQAYDGTDGPLLTMFFPELRFRMEHGAPVHIMAVPMDFTSVPAGRTMPFLMASLIITVLNVVFFFIAPIVLLILFLVRRKQQRTRTHFDRLSTGLILSGTLLALNNLALILRVGINPFRSVAELAPQIWMNYVLAGLTILLFAGSLWAWRTVGDGGTKRKALFVLTALLLALLLVVLWNWNFFVLL
ncbi:MAG: beta-lactamase family protein [Oscillospiraceae bacterium]|nr:beta-lactamase family protein [Oscillospiraceae bacterium]